MAQQHLILGLILSGCVAAVACSSDGDDSAPGSGGTSSAGHSGAGSHAGGSSGEGPAGQGPGGSAGEAGSGVTATAGQAGAGASANEAGAGGEAGSPVTVEPSAPLDPQVVIVPRPPPTTANHLLVAGTDFVSTEVVSITLDPPAVGDTKTYTDGDTVPAASGGLGFVLNRTTDIVNLMDGGTVKTAFNLRKAGNDTVALPTSEKAYVGLYNQSLIAVLNLTTGSVSRRIDLNSLNAPGDSDHSVDITAGAYDATAKIAYFLLERIDLKSIAPPDYTLPCTSTKALVVGIDATSDAIVDLNGSAAGDALELSLVDPTTLSLSADGGTLTLLANGCYVGGARALGGVEVVDLATHTSKVAYSATTGDYLSNLISIDAENALLATGGKWYALNLGSGVLGAELVGAPESAVLDGTDLIGMRIAGKVGSVVRYGVSSGLSSTVTATSWSGQYATSSGLALVP